MLIYVKYNAVKLVCCATVSGDLLMVAAIDQKQYDTQIYGGALAFKKIKHITL